MMRFWKHKKLLKASRLKCGTQCCVHELKANILTRTINNGVAAPIYCCFLRQGIHCTMFCENYMQAIEKLLEQASTKEECDQQKSIWVTGAWSLSKQTQIFFCCRYLYSSADLTTAYTFWPFNIWWVKITIKQQTHPRGCSSLSFKLIPGDFFCLSLSPEMDWRNLSSPVTLLGAPQHNPDMQVSYTSGAIGFPLWNISWNVASTQQCQDHVPDFPIPPILVSLITHFLSYKNTWQVSSGSNICTQTIWAKMFPFTHTSVAVTDI